MDWHYGTDDFPKELNDKCGGTHIGMFLTWIINNDLLGELHTTDSLMSIAKVKSREMTGTEFLQNECDGKFWEEDLSEEGNEFTKYYYESNIYYGDYESSLASNSDTLYHVEDTWNNYDVLSKVLDKQFNSWKSSKNKKWWQFWS